MKKTIKQWLETLPSPIKEKALANLNKCVEDIGAENLINALSEGFEWSETEEGYDYWHSVDTLAQAGDFDLEEKTFPREVYVDNYSEEDALIDKEKVICLGKIN